MKIFILTYCVVFIFSVEAFCLFNDFNKTDFSKADSIADLHTPHSIADLRTLARKLTATLPTEQEKFRSIYKWICNNIEYDYALFVKQKQQQLKIKDPETLRAWNKKFCVRVFAILREKQKTVCTGYAYLVRELAEQAGLRCKIIDGYGRTAQSNVRGSGIPNHSWNAVQLNNKWYLCDATWSSGAYDVQAMKFIKNFDPSYFLPDPSLFIRNHYPLDSSWSLLASTPMLNQFLNRPIIYSSLYRYKIKQILPETFDITTEKGKPVSFQFTTSEAVDRAELQIDGSFKKASVFPSSKTNGSKDYEITHTFLSKGSHIVHVMLDMHYVFSYTVMVR